MLILSTASLNLNLRRLIDAGQWLCAAVQGQLVTTSKVGEHNSKAEQQLVTVAEWVEATRPHVLCRTRGASSLHKEDVMH